MKNILVCGKKNKINSQNNYFLINNYLKSFYNQDNVNVIDHLSSVKNYKQNFDKKVSKYGNYLSNFYFEALNSHKKISLIVTCVKTT